MTIGKTIMLFVALLLCAAPEEARAQARFRHFRQKGGVLADIESGALVAAHPVLPLGSVVKLTRPETGEAVEVTITAVIPPSLYHIIRVSRAAAEALNIPAGGKGTVELEVVRSVDGGWGGLRFQHFRQRGGALANIASEELVAAHPVLPLGSVVKLTRPETGEAVEVTVTANTPPSYYHIIRVSRAAAEALHIPAGGKGAVKLEVVHDAGRGE